MRFSPDQLRDKALYALEEVYEQCREAPVPKSAALRFLLAYLGNGAKERWPFDNFWHEATTPPAEAIYAIVFGRRQSLTNAINGIYLQLGLKREGR